MRWFACVGVLVSAVASGQAPLELTATRFQGRIDVTRPTPLRDVRRAFPEYRVVRVTREAEAGGTYEALCFSRWGRDRRCRMEWTMAGDRVRRIQVFEPRASVAGLRIGDEYRAVADRLGECHTETGLIHALMCELPTIPDGWAVLTLEPATNLDPPSSEQLDNARVEWFDVSFAL